MNKRHLLMADRFEHMPIRTAHSSKTKGFSPLIKQNVQTRILSQCFRVLLQNNLCIKWGHWGAGPIISWMLVHRWCDAVADPGGGGGRIGRGPPPPFFGRFLFFGPIFVIFGRGIEEFGFPAPPFHRSWIRLCDGLTHQNFHTLNPRFCNEETRTGV